VTDKQGSLEAVAGPVSRETFERLLSFEETFRKWAERINLVAPSTLGELWDRHILDSAQLVPLIGEHKLVVDLGSGGGFPGAVLAILLAERGGRIDLVESNKKKAAFLATALAGLPVCVHPERIEAVLDRIGAPDVVTARALAPLNALLGLAEPWLGKGARGLFHKGREYRSELAESRDHWDFDLVERPSVSGDESAILDITRLQRRRLPA
jgi:16S rRNA (guanine527-N7)-methyltransferase